MTYHFEDFELDPDRFELRRGGEPVRMEPQVFDVLAYLVKNHERLVTKDELLEQVWGDKYVSEAALNSRLMAARRAVGDSGSEQRLIKTMHGRGYRFVGPILESGGVRAATSPGTKLQAATDTRAMAAPALTGRTEQLQSLAEWLQLASGGARQIVFTTGDAGIGKSTLVRSFASEAAAGESLVASGHCLEQRDGGEAYLPVFECLGRLCRDARIPGFAASLLTIAPTWALQMPATFTPEQLASVHQLAIGATRDRMLREMVECLEALAQTHPIVLLLEDLHWSDPSTLDLLSALARRDEPARLMVVATYRPADVAASGLPLVRIHHDLRARGLCRELPLPPLDESAVEALLAREFGGPVPAAIATALHRRTGGNPLFVRSLIDEIGRGGWPEHARDDDVLTLLSGVPRSLSRLIDEQLARLDEDARRLLSAAAVAGPVFSTTELSAALEEDEESIETRSEALARPGNVITTAPEPVVEWPDATAGTRYAFSHDLYQEALYRTLPPGQKARMHARIGARLETAYSVTAADHAAELAQHFSRGREHERALTYLTIAAEQATSRSAHVEAAALLKRALDTLTLLPDLENRASHEMLLSARLASALLLSAGFGNDDALAYFRRALDIAVETGDDSSAVNIAFPLVSMLEFRSEHGTAGDLLKRYVPSDIRGESLGKPYYALLSCSYFHQGLFRESVEEANFGIGNTDPGIADTRFAIVGEDPLTGCSEWSSGALWFLGYPDEALRRINAAVAESRLPNRRYSLASTQSHAARIHQLRREFSATAELAQSTIALAEEQGYGYYAAFAQILLGWTRAMQGDSEVGIAMIHAGMDAHRATGALMDRPYFLGLLAEAHLSAGDLESAQQAIDQAENALSREPRYFYEAEVYRLKGVLLARKGERTAAREWLGRALDVSRTQGAHSLTLRATIELARLDGSPEALASLQNAYDVIEEGRDTLDLVEARELLLAPASR
jgi:DNA-binding winged helix-turn-helix (wHTH) protein/tetratricopeptide (TPR) repeat protein